MARSVNSDFIHAFRFHAVLTGVGGAQYLQPPGLAAGAQAGFTQVTSPELTQDPVDYREGRYIYGRKYPGVPTIGGDLTLSRGVARQDSSFWDWSRSVAEGAGPNTEYRADMDVKAYHRGVALVRGSQGDSTLLSIGIDSPPAKTIRTYNGFPSRFKPAADFDATSSDVSIMEIDVAIEYFDVFEGNPPATPTA